jgi:formate hydrogenlyase subunit 3/multisubunit Na+/H+ antiporter MnhD subunit
MPMTLLLPLLVPLFGSFLVLFCKAPRLATRVALAIGTVELIAIANVVRVIHLVDGGIQVGNYLRADGLTSFFLVNIGVVFGLVLVY